MLDEEWAIYMVEKIPERSISKHLPKLRIDVLELIEFLRENEFDEVYIENNGYRYVGLSEIESHKALLSGFPKLRINNLEIDFNSYDTHLYLYEMDSELPPDKIFFEKVYSFFKLYEDKFIKYEALLFYFGLLVISFSSAVLQYGYLKFADSNSVIMFSSLTVMSTLLFLFVWRRIADSSKRVVIFYNPKESWLQKYTGQTIAAILGALATAVIIGLWGKLF